MTVFFGIIKTTNISKGRPKSFYDTIYIPIKFWLETINSNRLDLISKAYRGFNPSTPCQHGSYTKQNPKERSS
ncbi:hypothetical protein BABINDRAFT_141858 [Babjeviella inositovora NRRL Y-12698]|uniref:Uncharacterized protein n=1 Tax=Babjeviella inositovora NRRL Y-12698 TaxID=984486 RepID=A0A1E3QPJ1_9ASCO|nr:uncharacterized protein BABINDRAFT_141858 [Babjeviella inositovora NRRL Y-12698]ODQ79374.1 hypothetical protein BABINDRAFT_141858 [Babjeviella inositovora NRRL Y-12698]